MNGRQTDKYQNLFCLPVQTSGRFFKVEKHGDLLPKLSVTSGFLNFSPETYTRSEVKNPMRRIEELSFYTDFGQVRKEGEVTVRYGQKVCPEEEQEKNSMNKTNELLTDSHGLGLIDFQAGYDEKQIWSFWIIQALLWTILLKGLGIQKTGEDGSKQDFTIQDLKGILDNCNTVKNLSQNSQKDQAKDTGKNSNHNDSADDINLLYLAVINGQNFLLNTNVCRCAEINPDDSLLGPVFYGQREQVSSLIDNSEGDNFYNLSDSGQPNCIAVWFQRDPPELLKGNAIFEKKLTDQSVQESEGIIGSSSADEWGPIKMQSVRIICNVGLGEDGTESSDLVTLGQALCAIRTDPEKCKSVVNSMLEKYGWPVVSGWVAEDAKFLASLDPFAQYFSDKGLEMRKKTDESDKADFEKDIQEAQKCQQTFAEAIETNNKTIEVLKKANQNCSKDSPDYLKNKKEIEEDEKQIMECRKDMASNERFISGLEKQVDSLDEDIKDVNYLLKI